jgi:flagellar biogenesis protein FliO
MKLKAIFLAALLCSFSAAAFAEEDMSKMNEDQLVAAAEQLIASQDKQDKKDKVIEAEETSKKLTQREVTESKIPAFREKEKVVEASASPWARMILGGGVVLALSLGLLLAAKKMGKKRNAQDSKVRLDVISQKAISPKQNLLVVRVAGEHILIGATDHSINMIKSISLIDDETEDTLPQDFNNFLEDDFVEQSLSGGKKGRTFTL